MNNDVCARFDNNNHATSAGWATYQSKPMFRWRFRCWLGRHRYPAFIPYPANGHSPSNTVRMDCCGAFAKWFVIGQHRYGGINRYFARLDRGRRD